MAHFLKPSFLLLVIYFLSPTNCTSPSNIKTVTSSVIRRPRVSGSYISYRFNRRPRKKNMDTAELEFLLGKDFDPQFMSTDPPSDVGATYVLRQDGWKYREMIEELKFMNLTQELQQLGGEKYTFDIEHSEVVEKLLMKKASCPVKYEWEDIGALFWPRYIRRGQCTNSISCSWPPGMQCVPSATSNITILRWQCKTSKTKGRKRERGYRSPAKQDYVEEDKTVNLKCNWVKVPYPIISECICTC